MKNVRTKLGSNKIIFLGNLTSEILTKNWPNLSVLGFSHEAKKISKSLCNSVWIEYGALKIIYRIIID